MNSVLDNDKETVDKGKVINESINQGLSSFTPDLMFENIVKNYSLAERLYGKKLLRYCTGYDPNYIDRNIKIPEFKREIKGNIKENIERLHKEGLIDKEGRLTEKAIELATLVTYIEELDNITPKGSLGERVHKRNYIYGDKSDTKDFKKGDRYKDISLRKSVKTAIRRSHKKLLAEDLKAFERQSKGTTYIVYAIDASGSMKGNKIDRAKKAGIALAYKAINNKDKVGLVVFGAEVKSAVSPTNDFGLLLKEMVKIKASMETSIVNSIKEAVKLFPSENATKHLILLSDALPTIGKDPEKETLEAVANASSLGITLSVIGIALDKRGTELAKKIVELGKGRLYLTKDIDEIDKIVLEDYYEAA